MKRSLLFRLICLFGIVTGGYFTLQSMTAMVWDDTPLLCAKQYDMHPMLWSNQPHFWQAVWRDSFGSVAGSGYRPLNRLQNISALWLIGECGWRPGPWYACGAVVFGLLAVTYFLVARRFTSTETGALLAVFLLLFSTPVITGAWPVVCNCQATVPLTLCVGLLVYWRLVDSPSHKIPLGIALTTIFLLGPWVREFVGLLPVFVIAEEWRQKRRPTWIMGLACVGFLHALFPTALVHWLVYPDLPLQPVYRLGTLGSVLEQQARDSGGIAWFFEQIDTLKWHVPNHFLVLLPPCLLVLTFVSLVVSRPQSTSTANSERQASLRNSWTLLRTISYSALLLGYGTIATLFYISKSPLTGSWLVLGLTIVLFRVHSFLAFWFLVSFLPFLKAFTEQVHLAYALMPTCIGVAGAMEFLHFRVTNTRGWKPVLRVGLLAVLVVAGTDHALNLYGSFHVVNRINHGIVKMANWFKNHVPENSIIICNALHAEDIRFYSGNHITAYWTVNTGIPHPSRQLVTHEELEQFLIRCRRKTPVYFLDVEYAFRPEKLYHAHKYVKEQCVPMEKCGLIHITRARYPFVDPLKHGASRRFMSFLGSPDLENDFYTGPAREGTPFLREMYAHYHVYRITGTCVLPPIPKGPVVLRQEGYHHFNILQQGAYFYAIPQGEGAFDHLRLRKKGYSRAFVDRTLEGIRKKIVNHAGSKASG